MYNQLHVAFCIYANLSYEFYFYDFIVLQFRTIFTIKLLNTDVNQIGQKTTCKLLLVNQLDKDDFLEYTGSVQCDMGTTTIVRQTSDSSNQEISGGNQCENGIKKTIGINSSPKCSKNF